MTAEQAKENQDAVHLIAFYMLPMAIISGRVITFLLYEMNQKLNLTLAKVFPVFL